MKVYLSALRSYGALVRSSSLSSRFCCSCRSRTNLSSSTASLQSRSSSSFATTRNKISMRSLSTHTSQSNDKRTSNPSNSTMPRTNISLLGAMNAGKSVLMNLLTQSEVSIVHDTAGTTADPKACLMELHGRIGPVRLLDTPGIDEQGDLGHAKRHRALQTIGQCDCAIIVADPFNMEASSQTVADLLEEVKRRQKLNESAERGALTAEDSITGQKKNDDKAKLITVGQNIPSPLALLVFNLRENKVKELEANGGSVSLLLEEMEHKILDKWQALVDKNEKDSSDSKEDDDDKKKKKPPALTLPPTLAVDFTNVQNASRERVIGFLERYIDPRPDKVKVLPDWIVDTHAEGHSPTVLLNIPMDQQTPQFRLLRPQAMVQEALIRNFVSTYAYRMDLTLARFGTPEQKQKEKDRFLKVMDPLLSSGDLSLLITDSQAIDVVAPWTLNDSGDEIVPITTFSIVMIRYLSGGRLAYFADGLKKLDLMMAGQVEPVSGKRWRVLISEACNHTRLNLEKQCADIGTVQLPNHLTATLGNNGVDFEYAFGKHVIFDPARFDLVVHCGGCMLTPQQMDARVADLMAAGVPATNYGLLLSRIQSPRTLARVLKPWGIAYDHRNGGDENDPLVA